MRISVAILMSIGALTALWGCSGERGIDARYAYEKRVWAARMAERGIWLEPLSVRDEDMAYAIAAYEAVLADNPLLAEEASGWSPRVRTDIQKLRFSVKVALAKLYFVRLEGHAGVTFFKSGLQRHDLLLRDRVGLGLSLVKQIYAREDRDALELKCSSMLEEITADEHLWEDGKQLGDTLMAIPGYLAGIVRDRNQTPREQVELGEGFLGRIVQTWPDSLVAQKARLARADMYVVAERFEDAVSDLDAVLASGAQMLFHDETVLLRGEILAHGLGRYAEAESIFVRLERSEVSSDVSAAAVLDLAAVAMKRGDTSKALEMLHGLETAKVVAPDTRTAAMFFRAMALNDAGDWAESVTLLWRICRLHPFSRAGMVAPLIMIRHELNAGSVETASSIQRKAVEFYAAAIERNSASLSYRHLVKDYLIESYLIMGDPLGAAKLLEERAPSWSGENGAVGLIKSAMIYLNLLDDRENGVRMLEKCLDLFPSSRYTEIVRQRLDSLSHRQTVQ